MQWLDKIKAGLSKTSASLTAGLSKILVHRKLDNELLESLEELLIASDMGASLAADLVAELARDRFNKEITEEEVKSLLASYITKKLTPLAKPLPISAHHPQVILLCGTNGSGKTTTAAKLAAQQIALGRKVMLAACDTFRAAATEQLQIWAERIGCPIVVGAEGSDPASVAYRGYIEAQQGNYDLLLIDTAGRLHNKANLMEELVKICRVLKKIDAEAPHEVVLVLDATIGQNALIQATSFQQMVQITGLIITKLDGTAKGGITVAIADKLKLPIYAIGCGESSDDLGEFIPTAFAAGLLRG